MKEKLLNIIDKTKNYWTSRTKSQKGIFLGSGLLVIALIIGLAFLSFTSRFVPLYNNLSIQEVGQIKEELDARGVSYELEKGGETISVPEDEVDGLIVDLAGEGIPSSGSIDYSFFSDNASWGVTDNEFNVMKLDAMQTELAGLMKGIDGITDADVMINLPEESVFVDEGSEEASASIVLNTDLGYEFEGNQIESLYHLVSKALPNLPEENIVIMNQYFEYFDKTSQGSQALMDDYTYQQTIKQDVERDIERRLQQMVGAMVGMERVIVSVTADVDFTQENREEEIIEPVDLENMEGLPVSIETVHETYTGSGADAGGVAGTGDDDAGTGYEAVEGDEDGEYELIKETINNEFNRVRKDIVESPYKVRDLGIQVAVDNVLNNDNPDVEYLSQPEQDAVEAGITSILSSMIGTSIDKDYGEVEPEEKISIVFQEFNGKAPLTETETPLIPLWMYIVGGILLAIIIILVVLLLRNRNQNKEEDEDEVVTESYDTHLMQEVPDIEETEDKEIDIQKKQLEKMAKEKPEEFAKLLRSWIADD